jgi:2,3-bisphosphoglycerate-dependent phosphoglycerate mutase
MAKEFTIVMPYLILLRHGESQWNLENRFTGWVDVPLTPRGESEARTAGEHLRDLPIDKVYTSVLQRAIRTSEIALEAAGKQGLPTERDQALNERHYGDLQGLDKAETAAQYGEEQVKIWRRSYDVPPPGEKGESLKDTAARTLPYFRQHILPDIQAGRNVLVVAHGNSLRSIVMELDSLTREQVLELNIPTGIPLVYSFDDSGQIADKKYLFTRDDEKKA